MQCMISNDRFVVHAEHDGKSYCVFDSDQYSTYGTILPADPKDLSGVFSEHCQGQAEAPLRLNISDSANEEANRIYAYWWQKEHSKQLILVGSDYFLITGPIFDAMKNVVPWSFCAEKGSKKSQLDDKTVAFETHMSDILNYGDLKLDFIDSDYWKSQCEICATQDGVCMQVMQKSADMGQETVERNVSTNQSQDSDYRKENSPLSIETLRDKMLVPLLAIAVLSFAVLRGCDHDYNKPTDVPKSPDTPVLRHQDNQPTPVNQNTRG